MIYQARIVGGALRPEADGSTDDVRWIPLAEVAGLRRVRLVDAAVALWREAHEATLDVNPTAGAPTSRH